MDVSTLFLTVECTIKTAGRIGLAQKLLQQTTQHRVKTTEKSTKELAECSMFLYLPIDRGIQAHQSRMKSLARQSIWPCNITALEFGNQINIQGLLKQVYRVDISNSCTDRCKSHFPQSLHLDDDITGDCILETLTKEGKKITKECQPWFQALSATHSVTPVVTRAMPM